MPSTIPDCRLSCWQRPPRWLGAVALTGMLVLVGGAQAHASCGHYVKRQGPNFVPATAEADASAAQPGSMPCACQGAECRHLPAPLEPASPTAPTSVRPQQDAAGVPSHDRTFAAGRSWLSLEISSRPVRGYRLLLDRPPIVAA